MDSSRKKINRFTVIRRAWRRRLHDVQGELAGYRRWAKRLGGELPAKETRYVTEREVSIYTGFALQTIRNWRAASNGRGPKYAKIGHSVRYPLPEVVQFMEDHLVETQPID